MGIENRDYTGSDAWDRRPGGGFWASGFGRVLWWLGTGQVHLYTAFGIRVAMHASMIVLIGLTLLLGWGQGFGWQDRVISMAVLFGIVLLHEYGHCFAARGVGGQANDILMWPLGGLAFTDPPRRPLPTFLTIAAGPGVNVAICVACLLVLGFTLGDWGLGWGTLFNPFSFALPEALAIDYSDATFYLWYIFKVSYLLLLFNLLPIFPLDGGRMLQAALWPRVGYYKSMIFSLATGQIGCVALGVLALMTLNLWLVVLAVMFFYNNRQQYMAMKAEGPWGFEEEEDAPWKKSLTMRPDEPERLGMVERMRQRREEKQAEREAAERAAAERRVDEILAKISRQGKDSLTARERRVLEEATRSKRGAGR